MSPTAGDARLASGSKISVDTMVVAIVYAQEGTKPLFLLESQSRKVTILVYEQENSQNSAIHPLLGKKEVAGLE